MTDGCVHLTYNCSWKFHLHTAGQLLSGQPVRYGKGMRYGLFITYKITPAGSLSSSQSGGPPCRASPPAFGLNGWKHQTVKYRSLDRGLVWPRKFFPWFFPWSAAWRIIIKNPRYHATLQNTTWLQIHTCMSKITKKMRHLRHLQRKNIR